MPVPDRTVTYHTKPLYHPAPTLHYLLLYPPNSGEADLICGQILTPASSRPFPSSFSDFQEELDWFGRVVLLSIGSQRTNTDLISAQILFQSEHKSWHLLPDARCAVFSTIQPCTPLYVSNYLFLVTTYMGGWCLSLHLPSPPIVFDLRVEKHHNE